MRLLVKTINQETKTLNKNNIRLLQSEFGKLPKIVI